MGLTVVLAGKGKASTARMRITLPSMCDWWISKLAAAALGGRQPGGAHSGPHEPVAGRHDLSRVCFAPAEKPLNMSTSMAGHQNFPPSHWGACQTARSTT